MFPKFFAVFAVLVISSFGLAMGAKKPQNQQPKSRQLKMRIEIGRLSAKPFSVPGGSQFDFETALNSQLLTVLQESGRFVFKRPQPISNSLNSCTLDAAQLRFDGSANSFEFLGSGGLRFGYTPDGTLDGVSGDVSLNVAQAQMDFSIWASDPLSNFMRASANVGSRETETKVGAKINFKDFQLGPDYFFKTPLAKVTKKALLKGLASLTKQTENIEWEAKVLENRDTHLIINAGRNSGIKRGDKFRIHNVTHFWKGQPCQSEYLGNAPSARPVALVVVDKDPGDDLTEALVYSQDPDLNVVPGAKVTIESLEP